MIDFSISLAGMNQAVSNLNQTASKVAGFSGAPDTVDLSTEMVALIQSRNDFSANARVLKAEDQVTKSLLSILA